MRPGTKGSPRVLYWPSGLTVDKDGFAYVVDGVNLIQKFKL